MLCHYYLKKKAYNSFFYVFNSLSFFIHKYIFIKTDYLLNLQRLNNNATFVFFCLLTISVSRGFSEYPTCGTVSLVGLSRFSSAGLPHWLSPPLAGKVKTRSTQTIRKCTWTRICFLRRSRGDWRRETLVEWRAMKM